MGVLRVRLSVAAVFALALSTSACAGGGDSASPHVSAEPATAAPVVVGTITATITPEALRLGHGAAIDLAAEVRGALELVDGLLRITAPVEVRVVVDPDAAIPEVGVGGFTDPASGAVRVSLGPQASVPVRESLTVWLRLTLAHELDHTKRVLDGPGLGGTLGEGIVSEGLADTFSRAAFPQTPPIPWTEALQPDELDRLAAVARADADTILTRELHHRWFFGAGDLPRWAGYTIGTTWIRDFLTAHPEIDVTGATLLSANQIIEQ